MPRTRTKRVALTARGWLGFGVTAMGGTLVACGSADTSSLVANDVLTENQPFVAITRESTAAHRASVEQLQQAIDFEAPLDKPAARNNEFYLAINKNELGSRWFLSGYLKQYFPGGVNGGAARSLGTRVVSFRLQNGKVFVFDVDDRKKASDTFDPQVVVDAYPIVSDYDAFNRLPNSDQYVLVDPSAGLNDFDVMSDFYGQGEYASRFKVELSFLQRFRRIADGAAFEEVFSGYSDVPDYAGDIMGGPRVDTNVFRASGTLGIALRRYVEGEGFTPGPLATNDKGFDLYFRGDPRIVPDTGLIEQNSIKWNIKPGMTPIKWVIADRVNDEQASYPQYDIIGALKAGIENWNEVFGFPALEAQVGTKEQSFADDEVNYFIYDHDPAVQYAFADWRSNPNTGEVRGASVYFNNLWIDYADQRFNDDPVPLGPAQVPGARPSVRWKPLDARPLCMLEAPQFRAGGMLPSALPAGLTKKEKVELWLTSVAVHEIGHVLGLRHNFMGSLLPPSSSVMDYLDDADSIASAHPGSYDIAAIRYLYGLSPDLPSQPFCNDDGLDLDPYCNTFDKADPFAQAKVDYPKVVSASLGGVSYPAYVENGVINRLFQFLRSGPTSMIKRDAFEIAIAQVKVDPARMPVPTAATALRIDDWERRVLARLFLDAPTARGLFTADPNILDSSIGPPLLTEIEGVLFNRDGIRSYRSRRAMVDILKKLQVDRAHRALREAKAVLEASRPTVPPNEAFDLDDLIARVERAVSPYYN